MTFLLRSTGPRFSALPVEDDRTARWSKRDDNRGQEGQTRSQNTSTEGLTRRNAKHVSFPRHGKSVIHDRFTSAIFHRGELVRENVPTKETDSAVRRNDSEVHLANKGEAGCAATVQGGRGWSWELRGLRAIYRAFINNNSGRLIHERPLCLPDGYRYWFLPVNFHGPSLAGRRTDEHRWISLFFSFILLLFIHSRPLVDLTPEVVKMTNSEFFLDITRTSQMRNSVFLEV